MSSESSVTRAITKTDEHSRPAFGTAVDRLHPGFGDRPSLPGASLGTRELEGYLSCSASTQKRNLLPTYIYYVRQARAWCLCFEAEDSCARKRCGLSRLLVSLTFLRAYTPGVAQGGSGSGVAYGLTGLSFHPLFRRRRRGG